MTESSGSRNSSASSQGFGGARLSALTSSGSAFVASRGDSNAQAYRSSKYVVGQGRHQR